MVYCDGMSQPTSVAALQAALAAGLEARYLFFWGHTAREGRLGKECLSQWYPAPFEREGVHYPTAEHYMMHQKAALFGDAPTAQRMLLAQSPAEVKALGRAVRAFDEERWASARFDIVVRGNISKFTQHPELGAFLIATGDSILVEASPRDAIWGIGLSETDDAARDPARWRGLNLLGFALMVVRSGLSSAT